PNRRTRQRPGPGARLRLDDACAGALAIRRGPHRVPGPFKNVTFRVCNTKISGMSKIKIRSTTILCVRRDHKVVMAGDGQVTLGSEVLKSGAKKLRRLYNSKVLAGFAGSTADAFALFSRFEAKLEQFK